MKKNTRAIIITSSIILGFVILLSISSQTILFTWSPIKIGYRSFHFDSYDVYTRSNDLESVYKGLDDIIMQNENTHKLKYTVKPEIIICKESDMGLYVPWMGTRYASGMWPKTVYVSALSIAEYKDPQSSVKHELSHILLLQNYGNDACMKMWRNNEWLPEGFAVYITDGFPSYPTKGEVVSKMKEYGINYTVDSSTILSGKSLGDVFIGARYQIYFYFIKYLIGKYGMNTFISFLHDSFEKPDDMMNQFRLHFKSTFSNALIDFHKYLSET